MRTFITMLITTVISIAYIPQASAVESLSYEKQQSPLVTNLINNYLIKDYKTDISTFSIAEIDLNNDGIPEYILRQKKCGVAIRDCTHVILAQKNDEVLKLSEIRAQNLMVGGTFSYGIKDLLVFNDKINDYIFDIYVWSPKEKTYIMKLE